MVQLIVFLAHLWNARYRLILPILALPAIALAWSMGNTPTYHATTTLSLERSKVHSPLLQNIASVENTEILNRFMHNPSLLEDTLLETGAILPNMDDMSKRSAVDAMSKRISLKVVGDDRLQINYSDHNEASAIKTLEKLSMNFVDEILAPERLRIEQVLYSLGEQIRYYGELQRLAEEALEKALEAKKSGLQDPEHLKEIVRLEFDAGRNQAQRQLAQKEYDQLLSQAKSLRSSMNSVEGSTVLWFVETPTLVGAAFDRAYHISLAKMWAWIGLVLGLLWVALARLMDSSLRRGDDIEEYLGVKILGRLPSLGKLQVENGRLQVMMEKK